MSLFEEARRRRFLGPQPLELQLRHAEGFAAVCDAVAGGQGLEGGGPGPATFSDGLLDLGSGGGLPGLVLALSPASWAAHVVLLEGAARRVAWLLEAVEALGLGAKVEVLPERAEVAGRLPERRHRSAIVVARSFGRPSTTSECAAPLLALGGVLVVSEPPPESPAPEPGGEVATARRLGPSGSLEGRWPPAPLAELGFGPAVAWRACGFGYVTLQAVSRCPERYPRRTGVPGKRPLF